MLMENVNKLKGDLVSANTNLKTVKSEMDQCQLKVSDLQKDNEKLIKSIRQIYDDMEVLKRDNEEMHHEIHEKNVELDQMNINFENVCRGIRVQPFST